MVLPVKISADQTTHLAHTVDITGAGARLAGFRAQLQVGAIIELQRGPRKAKFFVRWIKNLDANEIQMGIECQEPQDKFWGVDLAQQDQQTKQDMDALMTLLTRSKAAT
jgi:hypothetical protein